MIPDKAKKVFDGVIFDVYQWEQEMFDGSFTTFERLRRNDAVNILAVEGDKIVIGKEMQPTDTEPFYTVFGGQVDSGEEPADAAKRELLEESGLRSEHWDMFNKYRFSDKIDWTVHLYIARDCTNHTDQHLDPGEKIEVLRVSWDDFMEILMKDSFRNKGFAYDILKMQAQGTLDEFKKRLFS